MTDDRDIAKLAGRYRGSPHATDVLAFKYENSGPWAHGRLGGEIFISLDTAKRQARERNSSFEKELILLSLHGLLHLEGLGDENHRDWCRMRRMEFENLMRIL